VVSAAVKNRSERSGALQLPVHQHVDGQGRRLGETNEAFKWLETSYREHGEWLVLLMVDPRFDSVRENARFQDLMRRMNFPRTSEDLCLSPSPNPLIAT
jgi:hypothetical protein